MRRRHFITAFLVLADFLLLDLTFLLAYWLRFNLPFLPAKPVEPFDLYLRFSFLVASFGCIALYASHTYDFDRSFGLHQIFDITRALTLASLSLMIVVYSLRGYITHHDTQLYSRLVIVLFWILSNVVMMGWRWAFNRLLGRIRATGRAVNRVLLLGTDETSRRLYDTMLKRPVLGYRPIGCLTDSDRDSASSEMHVLGSLQRLPEVLKTKVVDEVILTTPHLKGELIAMLMNACQRADVKFSMVPSFFEILTSHTKPREVSGIPIFSVEEPILRAWNRRIKRGMDILLSLGIIAVTFPVWMSAALAIRLESPGSVLFRQRRMGKGEKHFDMFKFRSMTEGAEELRKDLQDLNEAQGPIFKIREDPRMTIVGRWIRRWSIDELTQLINVINGEMSLVGPRPYPITESEQFDTFERRRYDALPGITGLAQVSGRSDLETDEILRLDLYYIENWSIGLDIQILLKTLPAVFTRRGAY